MTPYDVGLLILRLVLGLTLAAHGYNKFFGGGRIPGTARWFESIGMKPGKFHATVAATTISRVLRTPVSPSIGPSTNWLNGCGFQSSREVSGV